MFCEKCGAQLPDTASFCNKCGNTLRNRTVINPIPVNQSPLKKIQVKQTPEIKINIPAFNTKKTAAPSKKKGKGVLGRLAGFLLIAAFIIIAAVAVSGIIRRTSIYGTWTDAGHTIAFTFNKDGSLRVSGANNVLGADVFQFTKEDGVIHLQAQGGLASLTPMDIPYELAKDSLTVTVLNQRIVLYRAEEDGVDAESEDSGNLTDYVEDFVEETLDTVQVAFLYGTWTDSYGAVSFTFNGDGTLRITGMSDTLGVEAFTFTEVDDDTLQLKANSDNAIIGAIGLNMDYEIEGDTMTVTIAGKELTLVKKE